MGEKVIPIFWVKTFKAGRLKHIGKRRERTCWTFNVKNKNNKYQKHSYELCLLKFQKTLIVV